MEDVLAQSSDCHRAASSGDKLMDAEMLRELQQRGRFFYEMFPGAKASDEWQRHRDRMEEEHNARLLPSSASDRTEKSLNPE
jgi:hypothetical protein